MHTQGWLGLLAGSGWDVHVSVGGGVPRCRIDATFHTFDACTPNPAGNRVAAWWPLRRGLSRAYGFRFGHGPEAESRRLAALIRKLRPAVVHSLRLQDEGYTVLGALDAVREVGAAWIVSLWGSDLAYFGELDGHRERVRAVLAGCDFVTADCRRDLELARALGADEGKLFFSHAIPGNGGVDSDTFKARVVRPDPAARRIVLFPKASEDRFRRTEPLWQALARAGEALDDFGLVFLRADDLTARAVERLRPALAERCVVRPMVDRDEALDWMARARVMVAPSLSDGTPNVMLEAMAAGALPVLSPLDSIGEWITDGENGLLAANDDVDGLARAIAQACTDDRLVRTAAARNASIVAERADRKKMRPLVLSLYDAAASGGGRCVSNATGSRGGEQMSAGMLAETIGQPCVASCVAEGG